MRNWRRRWRNWGSFFFKWVKIVGKGIDKTYLIVIHFRVVLVFRRVQ